MVVFMKVGEDLHGAGLLGHSQGLRQQSEGHSRWSNSSSYQSEELYNLVL